MFNKIKSLLSIKKFTTLKLYMKSGNIITVDSVIDWKVEYNKSDGKLSSVTINTDTNVRKVRLIMTTLQLSQVEAITEE